MYNRQKSLDLRNEIVILRKENPGMTLREIGELVHRTRERVRQILSSEDVETRSAKRVENANRPNPICRVCHKEFTAIKDKKKKVYCRECMSNGAWNVDMGLRRRRIPRIDVPCTYCSTIVNIRETLYKRKQKKHKNLFCSSSCRSLFTWKQQLIQNINGRIVKVPLGRNVEEIEK